MLTISIVKKVEAEPEKIKIARIIVALISILGIRREVYLMLK
jgi:hypothetical protein